MAKDNRTISERLAAYGVNHEAAGHSRRLLTWSDRPIGLADSAEATALLQLLDAASRDAAKAA
jgi:hypothetical protein